MFQSFLSWMLLGMILKHSLRNIHFHVSILLIVDVTWDAQIWQLLDSIIIVSILLIVDVTWDDLNIVFNRLDRLWFQSFLSWMLLGMFIINRFMNLNIVFQSFLSWMLLGMSEVRNSVPDEFISFNPSYRGCYLGCQIN